MPSRSRTLLILFGLVLLTLVCYWPVTAYEFINYDDDQYVWKNPGVMQGLSPESIRWAFTTFHATNWHPLTWLSHQLDWQLFGPKAGMHHLTSLLIHCANVILLFLVLLQLTDANRGAQRHDPDTAILRHPDTSTIWACAFVAAIFAVHPTHIESVVWVSERKDVLSTFFWLATMGAYARYAGRVPGSGFRVPGWYVVALVCFALGLMAKPMLVTLPFVLLLLDYWPLNRCQVSGVRCQEEQESGKKESSLKPETRNLNTSSPPRSHTPIPLLVLEKLPFLLVALCSMIVTFVAQQRGGAVRTLIEFPLGMRLGNAIVSYVAYIGKFFWPGDLAVFYPFRHLLPAWQVIGSVIVLLAVSGFCLWQWRKRPYLLSGWLWYAGTLVPVVGIVQVGNQAMADRYTYVPSIGLTWMIAFLAVEVVGFQVSGFRFQAEQERQKGRKEEKRNPVIRNPKSGIRIMSVLAVASVLACVVITRANVKHWENSIALFEHALKVTERNWVAHNNLAIAYEKSGRHEIAFGHYVAAVNAAPNYEDGRYNLGNVLAKQGRFDEAEVHYLKVLELNPRSQDTLTNYGNIQLARGNVQEAIRLFESALDVNPEQPEAHNNLGNALGRVGRHDEAMTHYREALRLKPDYPDAHNNLAVALAERRQFDEAIHHYRAVLQLDPDYLDAHNNLGVALVRQGKYRDAIRHFQAVLAARPDHTVARRNLNDAIGRLRE